MSTFNVNLYDQSGNFGAGHVSESEIKGQTKLGGIINEVKETTKNTPDQKAETTKFLELTISGEFESIDLADILRIQSELISKLKNTQKTSINIVDAERGSIKLTFEGSEDELKQIQALIQSGELTELSGRTIENFKLIDSESEEKELRNKVNSRNQLVQEIRSQNIVGRNLQQSDLKFCDLREIFLEKADLRGANLRGTNLSDANLFHTNLSGADLSGAHLNRAHLNRADLRGSLLRGSLLRGANLSGANLSGAYLSVASLSGAYLSGAYLRDASLSGAYLSNTKIDEKTKLDSKWRKVWEIINQGAKDQDLSTLDLSNANLRSIDLSNARLIQTNLNYSRLENTNLIGANLIGADLRNAQLLNANLTDADLSSARVKNARFGNNKGISEIMKRDLKSRGAIFEDSPGDRSEVKIPTPV